MIELYNKSEVDNKLTNKQDTLVSGTNIKTVNGYSLLGSGNITISGGSSEEYHLYINNFELSLQINNSSAINIECNIIYKYPIKSIDDFNDYINDIANNTGTYTIHLIANGLIKKNNLSYPIADVMYSRGVLIVGYIDDKYYQQYELSSVDNFSFNIHYLYDLLG